LAIIAGRNKEMRAHDNKIKEIEARLKEKERALLR
jgi:hypothetical protein